LEWDKLCTVEARMRPLVWSIGRGTVAIVYTASIEAPFAIVKSVLGNTTVSVVLASFAKKVEKRLH
jgi:hypothetical protein